MLKSILAFLLAALLPLAAACADDVRSGRFVFSQWDGPALNVYFVEPVGEARVDAPVVIVMHGVNRNADDYRDNWRDLARQYGFRVYAPEFSSEAFPGAAMYNLGGVGLDGPSAYSALEPLFDAILARAGSAGGYHLFGHSAGAQFVHRAVLFERLPRLERAYAANAGWYTLPDTGEPWPYGLARLPTAAPDVERWLAAPLVVMLGEADSDPQDPNLRRTPEALAQGSHRFARGAHFMRVAHDQAEEMGVPLGWVAFRVPGVAHDNAGMARAAAYLIDFERAAQASPEP